MQPSEELRKHIFGDAETEQERLERERLNTDFRAHLENLEEQYKQKLREKDANLGTVSTNEDRRGSSGDSPSCT